MPARAPCPMATVIEMGVARPTAQGQAMINTAMAFRNAYANFGSGPKNHHASAVTMAIDHDDLDEVRRDDVGEPLDRRARALRLAHHVNDRASSVSAPTRSARITSEPLPFTVAPVTLSPAALATGTGSPVIMDSSTRLVPSSTVPSTGTFSPGFTRSRSPTCTVSSGTCSSVPSSRRRQARLGASFSNCWIAWLVWPIARNCRTSPSITSVTITAAASK